ncbi:MAG: site-specific integrase [Lachnospiraceae bacterium]|nr:site-specific integrase [Lachnospiraceae bacterium]
MAHIVWIQNKNSSEKQAKVVYEIKTLDGSRKRKSKTFPTKTPIREINKFKREMESMYEESEGVECSKQTVSQFLDVYFNTYENTLSPTTYKNYHQMANANEHGIRKHLGEIDIKKLKTIHVQKYANYLVSEGLSAKTVKNHIMMVHAVYDKAMKLHMVSSKYNIVSGVELPKIKKTQIKSYSEEEVKKLLEIARRDANEMMYLEILLAVGTGCRRAELAAIQIESIDFEKKILHITQSKVRNINGEEVLKAPKTSAGVRDIPLGEELIKALKCAVRRYNENKLRYGKEFVDSRFIFSNENGTPRKTSTMTSSYKKFMKAHEDEIRYLPLHSAGRHSFASIAIAQGTDIKAVQELLGHSDATTTLNTYANSYTKVKVAYASKLNELFVAKEA